MSVTGANRSTETKGRISAFSPDQHVPLRRSPPSTAWKLLLRPPLPAPLAGQAAGCHRDTRPWAELAAGCHRDTRPWAELAAGYHRDTRPWAELEVACRREAPTWAEPAAAFRPAWPPNCCV